MHPHTHQDEDADGSVVVPVHIVSDSTQTDNGSRLAPRLSTRRYQMSQALNSNGSLMLPILTRNLFRTKAFLKCSFSNAGVIYVSANNLSAPSALNDNVYEMVAGQTQAIETTHELFAWGATPADVIYVWEESDDGQV